MKLLIAILSGAAMINLSAPFLFSQTEFYQLSKPDKIYSCRSLNRSLADTVKPKTQTDKPFAMKKSPLKAVLFSAVLPGAGQFYNESYWKIPFILGICGYLGYEIYNQDKKYRDYRDRYAASQQQNPPDGDLDLKTLRKFYFDQRNDFIWYFTIAYVVNLVDAFIGAHLFDFDVRDENPTGGGKRFSLKMNLKL